MHAEINTAEDNFYHPASYITDSPALSSGSVLVPYWFAANHEIELGEVAEKTSLCL